jgi:hypothetical protein
MNTEGSGLYEKYAGTVYFWKQNAQQHTLVAKNDHVVDFFDNKWDLGG